jgi:hypothetical protein
MPYAGSLTLDDVEAKTDVLVLTCNRCERAGQYPVATLRSGNAGQARGRSLDRELQGS